MARPTLADRLRHMLDAIADVQTYTESKSFDDYLADHMLRHAIERCLEIISEASRCVPREAKARQAAERKALREGEARKVAEEEVLRLRAELERLRGA